MESGDSLFSSPVFRVFCLPSFPTGCVSRAAIKPMKSLKRLIRITLTTEQRTRVRETVFKSGPRVTNINFAISVGTVVPRTVHFAPLPASIVEIHPAWRGYDYFVYNDEVIIIEPHSHKIVEIIVVS